MGSNHSELPLLTYFCLFDLISSKTHQMFITLRTLRTRFLIPQKHMTLIQISNQKLITLVHNNNKNALTHLSHIRLHGNRSLYRAEFTLNPHATTPSNHVIVETLLKNPGVPTNACLNQLTLTSGINAGKL
jgi:hypothetical protein